MHSNEKFTKILIEKKIEFFKNEYAILKLESLL
jgi:hypothetical protein